MPELKAVLNAYSVVIPGHQTLQIRWLCWTSGNGGGAGTLNVGSSKLNAPGILFCTAQIRIRCLLFWPLHWVAQNVEMRQQVLA